MLDRTVLTPAQVRSSEDAYVDELYDTVPDYGAPLLLAQVPRAYIDLNRAPEELDPALIQDVDRPVRNPRISSGLGVIPRVVANGRAIYSGKLTRAEADIRIATHWHPYHRALQDLLDESQLMFGHAVLIDCHSMPHEAISHGPISGRPEVVLGDRFGASASAHVVDQVHEAFEAEGFRVARNTPFAGAYIAQHYGRPSRGQHAVQVELDRGLYLDESRQQKSSGFVSLQQRLRRVVARLVMVRPMARDRFAAE